MLLRHGRVPLIERWSHCRVQVSGIGAVEIWQSGLNREVVSLQGPLIRQVSL